LLNDYLAKGGGKYADVIAFHIYANRVGEHPVPEDVVRIVEQIKALLARHPEVAGKPLWITEGSWGQSEDTHWNSDKDKDDQASAFLMRFFVLAASESIERTYWYGWDVPTGTLWANGHELPAASAFKEVHNWLVGRSVSRCAAKSHVWSCDLAATGYRGRIVWDDEYQRTSSYDASGFALYRSASGEQRTIDPKVPMLTVGNSPVLLEERQAAAPQRPSGKAHSKSLVQ
jgi:hypothetical protein